MNRIQTPKHTLLIVDDERTNLMALGRTFKDSYEVLLASSGEEAIRLFERNDVSLVIADQRMPNMTGIELLERVKKMKPDTIRIMLTAFTDPDDIIQAINRCDLYQYITKPWEDADIRLSVEKALESYDQAKAIEEKSLELEKLNEKLNETNKYLSLEVEKRTRELIDANKKLEILATTDPLTDVSNRRYFEDRLEKEFNRVKRYSHPLSVIMLDIDHFKLYNDTHGHLAGDRLLKELADILKKSVRSTDFVSRYGGEEFVLTLPETNKKGALDIAERVRKYVAEAYFSKETLGVTLSLGIASYPDDAKSYEDLLDKADKALYLAKNQGRDRVVTF